MDRAAGWFSRVWQIIVHEFTHMTLGTALWMGFALLTLVLLILMCTRWGQVKPVWKCVVLSVFAHILLGGYAYGTRLIFTNPEPPPSDTVSLKLIDSDDPNAMAPDHVTTQTKPWDQFDLAPEAQPRPDDVQRLIPGVQHTVDRTRPETEAVQRQPRIPTEVKGEVVAPSPREITAQPFASSDAHRMSGAVAEAQQIEFRRQQNDDSDSFTAPAGFGSEQIGRPDPFQTDSLTQSGSRSVPSPLADQNPDRNQLLQKLANATSPASQQDLEPTWSTDEANPSRQPRQPNRDPAANADSPFQLASSRRRLADGQPMPDIYAGRSPELRKAKASRHGGSVETERAVDDALHWLVASQEADGSWSSSRFGGGQERLVLGHDRKGAGSNADTGITGLSLLAFLAAGHSHLEGEHRETVQRGLEFLLRKQASDGNLAGESRMFARMYCHAMATLAITETLAMTGDRRLKDPVQKAVEYSLSSQHPATGGWRYRPGDEGDMSQFGWQVLVLKSAELGGIEIPDRSRQLMKKFLASCTQGQAGGLAGYRPGMPPTVTMTAEALLCRYFLDDNVPAAAASEATQYLLAQVPGTSDENMYYWYYGTLAMFHTGGQAWDTWNHNLTKTLVASQIRQGEDAGSWKPSGLWAGYGGRVYSTAMGALCLEVYYRYQTR